MISAYPIFLEPVQGLVDQIEEFVDFLIDEDWSCAYRMMLRSDWSAGFNHLGSKQYPLVGEWTRNCLAPFLLMLFFLQNFDLTLSDLFCDSRSTDSLNLLEGFLLSS